MPGMPTITTAEELLSLREPSCRHELVRGQLRRSPFLTHVQGQVAAELATHLGNYATNHAIGEVLPGTGFLIERHPDTVRAPIVAFVRRDRLPREFSTGFFPGPPDLAVEVTSPNDTYTEVHEKVMSWLEHGTHLVWVIDPVARRATVYRRMGRRECARARRRTHRRRRAAGLRGAALRSVPRRPRNERGHLSRGRATSSRLT
jgi:Uma2 family endonuclease